MTSRVSHGMNRVSRQLISDQFEPFPPLLTVADSASHGSFVFCDSYLATGDDGLGITPLPLLLLERVRAVPWSALASKRLGEPQPSPRRWRAGCTTG